MGQRPAITHTHRQKLTDQLFIEVNISLLGLEPDDTEHHDGREDGGGRVSETDNEGVSEGVVVRLGVAGEGNECSGGHSQGEEDLCGRLQPHLRAEQLAPLQVCVCVCVCVCVKFDTTAKIVYISLSYNL